MEIVDSQRSPFEFSDLNAVIFVFSTTSYATFNSVAAYKNNLRANLPPGCDLALVGTKTDEDPQQVAYETGLELAKCLEAGYFHISILHQDKVERVFDFLLRRFLEKRQLEKRQPPFSILKWLRVNCVCGERRKPKSGVQY
jgi:Ras family